MDFSEGFCTEKFLHPQNSQRGVQAEDPACGNTSKKKKRKRRLQKKREVESANASPFIGGRRHKKKYSQRPPNALRDCIAPPNLPKKKGGRRERGEKKIR